MRVWPEVLAILINKRAMMVVTVLVEVVVELGDGRMGVVVAGIVLVWRGLVLVA